MEDVFVAGQSWGAVERTDRGREATATVALSSDASGRQFARLLLRFRCPG
jgi:hypothetical protein